MASQLVPSSPATIRDLLNKNAKALQAALPKHVPVERMIRLITGALVKNPKLQECSQISLLGAIMQSAFLGLEPNSPMAEADIIPYGREATFLPRYGGLLTLFRRSGIGKVAAAHVVKEGDTFTFQIGGPIPQHTFDLKTDRGKTIGAWAYFTLDTGETDFEIMSLEQMEKIRQKSPGKNSPAWVENTDEMYRKTVLKRLLKRAPKSVELADAVEIDNRAEKGENMDFASVLESAGVAIPDEKRRRVETQAVSEGEFTETGAGQQGAPPDNNPPADKLNPPTDAGSQPVVAKPSSFENLAPLQRFSALQAQAKNKHGKEATDAALKRAGVLNVFPSKMTAEQVQAGIDELWLMETASGAT